MINVEPYARHLLGEGYSVRSLAKTLSVPERTLRYWLKEKGGVPPDVAESLSFLMLIQIGILEDSIKAIDRQLNQQSPA
jgi:DNA-binding transcriptional MerR regulator